MNKIFLEIHQNLQCPKCGSGFGRTGLNNIICGRGHSYEVQDDKVFLINPPEDACLPRPTDVTDKSLWSPWRSANWVYLEKKLKNFPDNINIIDLGSGRSPFRDLTSRFFNLVSFDFYPHELVNVVCDINQTLPIKTGRFDAVIAANVLEHIPNPKKFLSECNRILKPGGTIIFITPFMMPIHEAPYEFNRLTSFMIEKYLQETGFENFEIEVISNFYNLYLDVERDFFNAAVNQSKPLVSLIHRLVRKINSLTLVFFKQQLVNISDKNYPHGYGFTARKI